MNNKQITNNIITNNIQGSFFTVLWRKREDKKVDFIDPLRISVYHHIILKEHRKYTFPDIMECSSSCNQQEYNFNNMDDIYGEDCDYYIIDNEIKAAKSTPEKVYNTFVEILENKLIALLNTKTPIYKKLCAYKIMVMKGCELPIYGITILHDRFKKFDLLFGNDILKDMGLTRTYIKQLKKIL